MREIKFRQWDSRRRIMHLGSGATYPSGWIGFTCVSWENSPIMQYTGKKDKDGCELFENDIVADEDGNTALILWSKRQAQFYVDYDEYQDLDGIGSWATKIGNIYENPELVDK